MTPASVPDFAGAAVDLDALLRLRRFVAAVKRKRGSSRSPHQGPIPQGRRGRGLEVFDVRPWSAGDDTRHLDRNVTARTGAPHVRACRDERERAFLLVLDFRPSMLFGTRRAFLSVAATEALGALAWLTITEGGRAGFLAIMREGVRFFGWARGAHNLMAIFHEIAAAHRAGFAEDDDRRGVTLADALEAAAGVAGGADIVIATGLDRPGARFDETVAHLARRAGLSFALIVDRFELAPAAGLYPARTAADETGWLRVGRRKTQKEDDRIARLRRLGVRFVQIDSSLGVDAAFGALERLHD